MQALKASKRSDKDFVKGLQAILLREVGNKQTVIIISNALIT